MRTYEVIPEEDGSFTLWMLRYGVVVSISTGYKFEASARAAGYAFVVGPSKPLKGYGSGSDRKLGWRR